MRFNTLAVDMQQHLLYATWLCPVTYWSYGLYRTKQHYSLQPISECGISLHLNVQLTLPVSSTPPFAY